MKSIRDYQNAIKNNVKLFRKDGNINSNILRNLENHESINELYKELVDYYGVDESPSFLINLVLNDYTNYPKCKQCGSLLSKRSVRKTKPFIIADFCSSKCAASNDDVWDKKKKTTVERYGHEFYSQTTGHSKRMKSKDLCDVRKNNAKMYYESLKNNDEFDHEMKRRNGKRKETNIKNYGSYKSFMENRVKKYFENNDIEKVREKQKETFISTITDRYGSLEEYYKQKRVPELNAMHYSLTDEQIEILTKKDVFEQVYNESGNNIPEMSKKLGFNQSTLYKRASSYGIELETTSISYPHQIVCDILDELGIGYVNNDRNIIKPYEIDILCDNSIGIEINGTYWHCDKYKEKYYHYKKSDLSSNKGIHLIHLNDIDILDNKEKVESIIRSIFGIPEKRIYARKCDVVSLDTESYRKFCNMNHIQNYVHSEYKYGLIYNGQIVMIMSFSKSRYDKNYEYELMRLCSLLDVSVVGGASKLFRHFIKTVNPTSIISYCDRSIFSGGVYKTLGFVYDKLTPPGYKYYKSGKLYSRHKFQKHKLKTLFPDLYSDDKSENNIMIEAGYNKLWDCGQKRYVWTNKNY